MKPVNFRKLSILRALVTFLLITVLAACSSNNAATSSPAQSHPGTTESKSASPSPPSVSSTSLHPDLNLNQANLSVQQGDLLIQSSGGFQCPFGASPGELVFASDPTVYSQTEIAPIQAYVNSNFLTSPPFPPPLTLRWVLGGSNCGAIITLTNTGNTPIQIPKVGVQLKLSPQQNTYQYRLLNICSLWPLSKISTGQCPPRAGGGTNCNYYTASIQLGLGEQNTVFSATPIAFNRDTGADCGVLTLAPAAQDKLAFVFSLAPNTPDKLMYSIAPVFTVDTAQGEQTLAPSQLVSTLAFASASQFSCYTLQGMTFALMQSSSSEPAWCL